MKMDNLCVKLISGYSNYSLRSVDQVEVFYLSGTQNNTRLDRALKFLRQDNAPGIT